MRRAGAAVTIAVGIMTASCTAGMYLASVTQHVRRQIAVPGWVLLAAVCLATSWAVRRRRRRASVSTTA